MTTPLSHFDDQGASRMVDVGDKSITTRTARARALVRMKSATADLIRDSKLSKGDVLEVARLAGIMAAKRTDELIPLCHSLGLDAARVDFDWPDNNLLRIETSMRMQGRTGVEMEALTAASIAALTVYDMCKAVDRGMSIEQIYLLEKTGGKSGDYRHPVDAPPEN